MWFLLQFERLLLQEINILIAHITIAIKETGGTATIIEVSSIECNEISNIIKDGSTYQIKSFSSKCIMKLLQAKSINICCNWLKIFN